MSLCHPPKLLEPASYAGQISLTGWLIGAGRLARSLTYGRGRGQHGQYVLQAFKKRLLNV